MYITRIDEKISNLNNLIKRAQACTQGPVQCCICTPVIEKVSTLPETLSKLVGNLKEEVNVKPEKSKGRLQEEDVIYNYGNQAGQGDVWNMTIAEEVARPQNENPRHSPIEGKYQSVSTKGTDLGYVPFSSTGTSDSSIVFLKA
ncbi:hypothetical protein NDU88_005375 [Pleurodeles waltl]|uniref:Uncharacterized protein n=1 Tax=Pleurodeles waltl TaxID=8319 RepID=A0AAV7UJ44_PLEWA|nr:hypothetical protein NDU88_005375 [Pleurodeles waltl]